MRTKWAWESSLLMNRWFWSLYRGHHVVHKDKRLDFSINASQDHLFPLVVVRALVALGAPFSGILKRLPTTWANWKIIFLGLEVHLNFQNHLLRDGSRSNRGLLKPKMQKFRKNPVLGQSWLSSGLGRRSTMTPQLEQKRTPILAVRVLQGS